MMRETPGQARRDSSIGVLLKAPHHSPHITQYPLLNTHYLRPMTPIIQTIMLHRKQVDVLRLDKMTPGGIGNKYYKLRYNLLAAKEQGLKSILSFGGAFSNHLHALSAIGKQEGFQTIGVVRGEDDPDNPTLQDLRNNDMHLHFISRQDYRQKNDASFIRSLEERYGSFYLLPEGGSNSLAVQGCREILQGVKQDYDHILVAVGTGATVAGIVATPELTSRVTGIAVLKGEDGLSEVVQKFIEPYEINTTWDISFRYHLGGYARYNADLMEYIRNIRDENELETDPVYTSKVVWACADMLEKNEIRQDEKVLLIHTGGLQGWTGWNYRFRIS